MQSFQLTRILVDAQYKVTICCYFEHSEAISDKFKQAGAEIKLLNLDRSLSPFLIISILRRNFRQLKPDVAHIQYMAPGFLPVVAAWLARVPRIVATVHQPARTYGLKAKILLRTAALLCDRFICVSEAVERSWFGDSRLFDPADPAVDNRRHWTIHNSVDIERIDEILASDQPEALRKKFNIPAGPVIGAVSRLRQEKGIDVLISAFAKLSPNMPDVRLLLVGDGPDRSELEKQAADLGISSKVLWTGQQAWDQAIALMSLMDFVVVPSRWEGFGLTAIEAMAARRPVVATAVDGLVEAVGTDGLLVQPDDADRLAAEISNLLKQPQKLPELQTMGRTRAEAMFSHNIFRRRVLASDQAIN